MGCKNPFYIKTKENLPPSYSFDTDGECYIILKDGEHGNQIELRFTYRQHQDFVECMKNRIIGYDCVADHFVKAFFSDSPEYQACMSMIKGEPVNVLKLDFSEVDFVN